MKPYRPLRLPDPTCPLCKQTLEVRGEVHRVHLVTSHPYVHRRWECPNICDFVLWDEGRRDTLSLD